MNEIFVCLRTAEFKLIARPRSPDISPEPCLGDDCASDQRISIDRQLKNRNLNVECDRSSYLRPQSRCTRTLTNNQVITHGIPSFLYSIYATIFFLPGPVAGQRWVVAGLFFIDCSFVPYVYVHAFLKIYIDLLLLCI